MIQIVRRQENVQAVPVNSRRERILEMAFVGLASINLFVITSAAALYFLAHKH